MLFITLRVIKMITIIVTIFQPVLVCCYRRQKNDGSFGHKLGVQLLKKNQLNFKKYVKDKRGLK